MTPVHNHGPRDGAGLECPERIIDGKLTGECLVPRELSAGEIASLEKVAQLRGFAGRMRSAIRDALDSLRPDEPAANVLRRALEEKAP
jgi:hypothetical protein